MSLQYMGTFPFDIFLSKTMTESRLITTTFNYKAELAPRFQKIVDVMIDTTQELKNILVALFKLAKTHFAYTCIYGAFGSSKMRN